MQAIYEMFSYKNEIIEFHFWMHNTLLESRNCFGTESVLITGMRQPDKIVLGTTKQFCHFWRL